MPKGYDRGRSRFERGREGDDRDDGRRQGYGYGYGDEEYDSEAPAFGSGSPIFGGDPDTGGGRPVFRGERPDYGEEEEYDPDTPAFGGPPRDYDEEGREYGGEYDGYDRGGYGGDYDDGSFEDDWGYDDDGRGRRLSTIIFIAIAVVVVVTIVIITKNLFGSSPSQGPTASPPATVSPIVTTASAAQPSDTPLLSESPAATETPLPTETPTEMPTETPTATPLPTQTPEEVETMTVPPITGKANVSDFLSLRKSASASSEKLAEIPKDGTFKILEVSSANNKWLKVEYSGKTGYVNANWVAIGDDGNGKVCTIATHMLNVRSGAGATNPIVGVLKEGDTVLWLSETTVTGTVWCKIQVGDVTGYVSKKFCRVLEK